MARLRQRLRRGAAAVSAALMLTAVPMPALTASAAEPVLRMNLIGGGSVIGIGWQLEAPDGLSGYSVTLDGKKVRPEADGTFSSYDYAMDMTKPHTVTVSKGGRQVLKKEASVCSYLNSLLADSSYSGYFPVAEAMLVYGGAAQEYFGVDTEHLASEGIDSTAALNREIPEDPFDRQDFEDCFEEAGLVPVKYTGMNLALQSEVRFSLFFEATGTAAEAERYLRSCTVGGEPAEITPYGENGWRMSRTVNVKDLDKILRFEEETGCGVEVRPVQYLTLAEKTGDEALIRVCKALYNYATVAKRAASPIRSIELKKDYFCDWTVGEDHAYMWDPNDLQNLMLGEDGKKKYERSVPEQLCLERTDKAGQTVKIPVRGRKFSGIEIDPGDDWNDMPEWLKRSDYEEAEKLLSSNSENWEYWSHVSAKYEQDDEKDVLLLFVTLGEPVGEFALQNLQLDADENLTVSSSFLQETDYSDGDVIWAYRLEFPKGTLSGEYIPENDGGQQPEDDAVIRDIGLDTEYYYDLEKMYDCGSGMFDEADPDSEMLVRDPEAFRASLPETLVIEKTDGTGKTVQIPVLKQDRAADEAWRIWGRNAPAPDWLKKEDYKAAEKALCNPMFGMQRVSARLEQGEETDVLLLYFTWNFMSGDLGIRNLKFDANGKLTVGVSFCRTTEYGWGSDIYAYRLELPHGAL